jgi:hypothetical protein
VVVQKRPLIYVAFRAAAAAARGFLVLAGKNFKVHSCDPAL